MSVFLLLLSLLTVQAFPSITHNFRQQQKQHYYYSSQPIILSLSKSKSVSLLLMQSNDNDDDNNMNSGKRLVVDWPKTLVLASGSFTRKLILKEMGIDFCIVKRPIDEKKLGDRNTMEPSDLVVMLAKAKANHVVQEIEKGHCQNELKDFSEDDEMVILTADQVVTCNGRILEKPENVSQAKEFIRQYATSPPSTVGSCVLTHLPSHKQVSGWDTATIHFQSSIAEKNDDGKDLIDLLLQDNAPVMLCAGGLMIEHDLVQKHVKQMDGTVDSVMGLSKDLVLRLLNELKQAIINDDEQKEKDR